MKSAHFINWMGNKYSQRGNLRMALPIDFDQLIEGFAGSAGFSRTLVNEGVIDSSDVWLNDQYVPLGALWKCVSGNVNELVCRLMDVREEHGFGSQELYEAHLNKLREHTLSDVELAEALFITNRLCGGSFMLGDMFFESPMKRAVNGLRLQGIENLWDVGMLMNGCKVTCGDYQKIVPSSHRSLLFLDPPYKLGAKKETRFYGAPFAHQRFATWCHRMKDKCHILITYDDNAVHLANFKGWHVYRHNVFFRQVSEWRKEMIITNYEIPYLEMLGEEWEIAA